jgi:hypothetical protein
MLAKKGGIRWTTSTAYGAVTLPARAVLYAPKGVDLALGIQLFRGYLMGFQEK